MVIAIQNSYLLESHGYYSEARGTKELSKRWKVLELSLWSSYMGVYKGKKFIRFKMCAYHGVNNIVT